MSRRPHETPWSLKGVSPQVRQLAKKAASQAGVPIGTWLSAAIRETGEAELAERRQRMGAPTGPARPDQDVRQD